MTCFERQEISGAFVLTRTVNTMLLLSAINTVFSRGVTAAILVSRNKGTTAMFVVPTCPLGIELYSYANVFLCFG